MRTRMWAFCLLGCLLLTWAATAAAQNRGAQTVVRDAAKIEEIMQALENSV